MARLLPVPAERNLPGRRHQLLKDHLMREAQQSTAAATAKSRPRRRLAFVAIPLAAGAMAAALAAGGGLFDQHSTTSPSSAVASGPSSHPRIASPAAVLLDRIATVAASKPSLAIRDDQYVRITSKAAYSSISDTDPVLRLGKPEVTQFWFSVDGSRPGLMRADGTDIKLDASPAGTDKAPALSNPTYRYLESLPTDPDKLLKKIYDETKGKGPGPDQEAFVTIGDLLKNQLVPPKASAALYKAAARIPGVTVVSDAVDAAGRHGTAVARVHDGERTEWIFDRQSLEFLGERSVMVKDTPSAKAGQVTATTAVLARTIADRLPEGWERAGAGPGAAPGRAS
ncbi:CU044_5270 family protein [Streptomyces sp. NBC_00233]|uniref:CU044_5270 family protein n=1 Tax=Streptomyces sp. NBC_00233 TaxID=2975686 RepID=UPI00224F93FD|nr:CU044_5270 family protein [Streptomyces sp. NBC_00233]MCX5233075.1 CU044_5270 family protein [Streptomyces sp. NBC_00233]